MYENIINALENENIESIEITLNSNHNFIENIDKLSYTNDEHLFYIRYDDIINLLVLDNAIYTSLENEKMIEFGNESFVLTIYKK